MAALSDRELCEPGLIFWLVEELLDSQTIDGCRIVFDYLDSRRDQLTAKHFKEKSLIILRTCNELLRRLSRAEDTVFCGRVFIFLFQSFPLGDRSSVNLRGEFHVENVTTYEAIPPKDEVMTVDGMSGDGEEVKVTVSEPAHERESSAPEHAEATSQATVPSSKTAKLDGKDAKSEEPAMDMDALYTTFWSLQSFYSQPTKLFEEANLELFKRGLHATMRKFKEVQKVHQPRGPTKVTDEGRRGVKRKREGPEDELSGAFNPKYLTSRDLFDLEISDLAFRRHIMVQSLIIVDFLLSQSPKSKKKLEHLNTRNLQYGYTLSEDNIKWATDTRADISFYLMQGPEGKFYYRMVDTVLSRDKNWTYWKVESCPPIERSPVTAEDFSKAMKGAQKTCANKRLKSTPLGTLDLKFLNQTGSDDGMEKLKESERYSIPTAESFERPIADDQFTIEMGSSAEEKQSAEDAKASKLWRALRIASRNKLKLFDRIDDGKNMDALFRPGPEASSQKMEVDGEERKGTGEVRPATEGDQTQEQVDTNSAVPALEDATEGSMQDAPASGGAPRVLEEEPVREPTHDAPPTDKGEEVLDKSAQDGEPDRVAV